MDGAAAIPVDKLLRSLVPERIDLSGIEIALRVRRDVVEHVELAGAPPKPVAEVRKDLKKIPDRERRFGF